MHVYRIRTGERVLIAVGDRAGGNPLCYRTNALVPGHVLLGLPYSESEKKVVRDRLAT